MAAVRTEGVERVCGIDFSGARDAGAGIWVAVGRRDADAIVIERCGPAPRVLAAHYDGEPTVDRAPTLAALRRFVGDLDADTAVGFDFSFGLPAGLARATFDADDWAGAVRGVAGLAGPDALKERGREWAATDAEETYVGRATDAEYGAFSPYHWFVAHQTYHGAAGVLAPLLERDAARFVPMQADRPAGDRPVVLETYPAATLAAHDLHREGYKDADDTARARRAANLEGLRDAGLRLGPDAVEERVLADADGDGLDSLVAAWAVERFLRDPTFPGGDRRLEGHIYA